MSDDLLGDFVGKIREELTRLYPNDDIVIAPGEELIPHDTYFGTGFHHCMIIRIRWQQADGLHREFLYAFIESNIEDSERRNGADFVTHSLQVIRKSRDKVM